MARGRQEVFTTVRSEGALLPPDFLRQIAEGRDKIPGLTPEAYHLPGTERLNEAASRSWNRLLGAWGAFQTASQSLAETEPGTGVTREKWLLPLFQELGYGRLLTAKTFEIEGKPYPISHAWQHTPIHLVGRNVDLDRRSPGVAGAAKASPHGLVQEFLNRSPDHLWGVLSNGIKLRILRESKSLTRQAYIEFDLAGMMEGQVYADFAVLWLLCHQSRVEAERSVECWLERWSESARAQGTRALDTLRDGVQKAIEALGRGLLGHPTNTILIGKLRCGSLGTQDYYRQLLRAVYRMIFLYVAEDRDLLLIAPPGSRQRQRYLQYYSMDRLRSLAEQRRGTPHVDLWRGARLVFQALGSDAGCPELGLPALGSYLWSTEATPDLNACELANADLLATFRSLAYKVEGGIRRRIDYKNLGSQELGSVYESLLELQPDINADTASFSLKITAGHERKTSGSYYTHDSLVQCLLDSALEPVMDEAVKGKTGEDAARALLALKVCDLAVGSGHFLIAVAHRLAKRVAAARTGDEEPSPQVIRTALRDVIGRCLYGVDVNPMAAELCRVSLWLEALEPGKPLSFLDHHIRVGNSLVGAAPKLISSGLPDDAHSAIEGDDKNACAVLKKLNKVERKGLGPLFAQQDAESQTRLQQAAAALEELPDDRPEHIRAKELAFRRHEQTDEYRHKKRLADAWCAAFFIRKHFRDPGRDSSAWGITQGHMNDLAAGQPLPADLGAEVEHLSAQYQFFHWHLAFPEVFAKGGFDLVLGNPPWDTMSPDAKEFFSSYEPQVRFQDREGQQRIINELLQNPTIAQRWQANCRDLYGLVHFIKQSGRYQMFAPGNLGKGDFNIYRMFVEAAMSLSRRGGWASQIVPEGLYNGANCMAIRRALYETCQLERVYGFENANEVWFTGIDTRMKFCLYAAHVGLQTDSFRAGFNIRSLKQLAEVEAGRSLNIPVRLVKEFSPDALAIMELGSQMDIDIAAKMYRWPAFGDDTAGPPIRVYMAEVHMGNDRKLFTQDPSGIPLYEGRMVAQFDYRAKGYRSGRGRSADWEDLRFGSPGKSIQPQWYIAREDVPDKCVERMGTYRIGFCDVASPTNERTLVASIIPSGSLCGHKVPTLLFEGGDCEWYMVAWVAIANSYAMDFIARKKVSLSLTYTILDSLPFPRLDRSDPRVRALVPRCLGLSCTGPEMIPFWNRLAAEGWVPAASGATETPGELDDEARLQIRAEIDAIVARDLFALTRPELEYILTTFPTQQRYQEEKYGEFRSRRLILNAFEQMGG
jgi:hypothetical protein